MSTAWCSLGVTWTAQLSTTASAAAWPPAPLPLESIDSHLKLAQSVGSWSVPRAGIIVKVAHMDEVLHVLRVAATVHIGRHKEQHTADARGKADKQCTST